MILWVKPFWLQRFRVIDITDKDQRQRLIDTFVNAVYLYDDKIVLTFNYKDGSKTLSLQDIESSDLFRDGLPNFQKSQIESRFFEGKKPYTIFTRFSGNIGSPCKKAVTPIKW